MKPIDTHAHLQFEKFDSDREEVVQRNSEQLLAIINPGADLDSSNNAVKLAARVSNFYAAIGVHPHHVDNWDETYLPTLEKLATQEKVVAIGEIGLDNYQYQGYPEPDLARQRTILIPQIELATKYQKPLLFHCRQAYEELYEVIKNYSPLNGLIHCFMGDQAVAEKFVGLGLLISFAGNLTYKTNEAMRDVARTLPSDKILVETDSPYLTPEPLRGQRNEPVNIIHTINTVAQLRGLDSKDVVDFTAANAQNLFKI